MRFVPPMPARPTQAARAWRELGIVVLAMIGYFVLRLVVEGDRPTARRNADDLLDLEARLGVDVEGDVQRWVLEHETVRELLSGGYVWFHWPFLVVAMVFLAFRAPPVLARLRNAMIVSGAIGIVLFALVPMAPPRFMPGFVGTVSDSARRHYLPYSLEWTNQVAAFPSYHVGWTLIAGLAVAGMLRRRWTRLAIMMPALVVAISVVGTGNHYVLDSVSGALFAVGAWWLAGRWGSAQGSPGDRDDRDRGGVPVDADDSAVGDPGGRAGGGHDARPAELARDDDRVAHLPADVDHDRLDRHEQRCP